VTKITPPAEETSPRQTNAPEYGQPALVSDVASAKFNATVLKVISHAAAVVRITTTTVSLCLHEEELTNEKRDKNYLPPQILLPTAHLRIIILLTHVKSPVEQTQISMAFLTETVMAILLQSEVPHRSLAFGPAAHIPLAHSTHPGILIHRVIVMELRKIWSLIRGDR